MPRVANTLLSGVWSARFTSRLIQDLAAECTLNGLWGQRQTEAEILCYLHILGVPTNSPEAVQCATAHDAILSVLLVLAKEYRSIGQALCLWARSPTERSVVQWCLVRGESAIPGRGGFFGVSDRTRTPVSKLCIGLTHLRTLWYSWRARCDIRVPASKNALPLPCEGWQLLF